MMKFLDEVEKKNNDAVIQQPRVEFQKANLLKSVGDFSIPVLAAIEKWLFSFPSGLTSETFKDNIKRLDKDESIALAQLKEAHGFRTIKKRKEVYPILEKSFFTSIQFDMYCYTIVGTKSACQEYVLHAIKDLKPHGSVYVLDCAVLFHDFRSMKNKGNSDELLSNATKCDFLIIENLAQDIGLVSKVSCWALATLVNERHAKNKPTLCRYNNYKELAPIYEKCPIYEVK